MASVSTLINRMRYWCAVANLGYSQADRWNFNPSGGNCDCSSLVIHCLKEAGFDTGSATYTGNLSDNLTKRGWTRLPADGNPQAGDILLNDVHHVAVYLGGGRLAQASISERGTAYGRAGDQTGRETNIRAYYNYPWNAYLRYMGAQSSAQAAVSGAIAVDGIISGQQVPDGRTYARPAIDSSVVRYGSGGSDLIRAVQRRLGCGVDGLLGPATIKAIQRHYGLAQDASFGPATARALQTALNQNRF